MKAPTTARPAPTAIAPRLPYRLARLANHMRSVADFCEREAGRGGDSEGSVLWACRSRALTAHSVMVARWGEIAEAEAAARTTGNGDK